MINGRISLFVILLICSCRTFKSKYFYRIEDNKVSRDELVYMPLDSTYELFVRSVCRPKPAVNSYENRDPLRPSPVVRCNCEEMPAGKSIERMELQYLFYSATKQAILYITTIPTYPFTVKRTIHNLYDTPLFDNDSFVNVNNFNTFFLGHATAGYIEFPDNSEGWTYNVSGDGECFTVCSVKGNRIDDSFAFPVKFYKKRNWTMGISVDFRSPILRPCETDYVKGPGIYFSRKSLGTRPPFVMFEFETPYDKEELYTWIYFKKSRLKHANKAIYSSIPQ